VIDATEGVAIQVEQRVSSNEQAAAWGGVDDDASSSTLFPQNSLCTHFPELWRERHQIMAHLTLREAASQPERNILLVVLLTPTTNQHNINVNPTAHRSALLTRNPTHRNPTPSPTAHCNPTL